MFDIQQGVSINLFVKTGKKKKGELAKVLHYDLYGERADKYDFLWENTLASVGFAELGFSAPQYFFVNKNFDGQNNYEQGFLVNDLFLTNSMGITSGNDFQYVNFSKESLTSAFGDKFIEKIDYRPFDMRYICYDYSKIARSRSIFMAHLLRRNVAITLIRRSRSNNFISPFIVNHIVDKCISSSLDNANIFPLYLYPESGNQITTDGSQQRTPNLNKTIVDEIAASIGLTFTPEKEESAATFAPLDILDYIYAVLHCPGYREKYKEFLKIDFPRVPYPKSQETFRKLAALGAELRQLHLLESPALEQRLTSYPVSGDNVVGKLNYQEGKVYINETQYFDGVPLEAWEFYIGGYQPAQKWLKDRKGKELNFEDVRHYQRIIVALSETNRIMGEIDKIDFG
ncbi:MAG: hypothetical protein FDX18_11330 [Chlorobium sp.]|nr:MAG: hypothetical protein FDX18_11330 [Chlorobium sp.]